MVLIRVMLRDMLSSVVLREDMLCGVMSRSKDRLRQMVRSRDVASSMVNGHNDNMLTIVMNSSNMRMGIVVLGRVMNRSDGVVSVMVLAVMDSCNMRVNIVMIGSVVHWGDGVVSIMMLGSVVHWGDGVMSIMVLSSMVNRGSCMMSVGMSIVMSCSRMMNRNGNVMDRTSNVVSSLRRVVKRSGVMNSCNMGRGLVMSICDVNRLLVMRDGLVLGMMRIGHYSNWCVVSNWMVNAGVVRVDFLADTVIIDLCRNVMLDSSGLVMSSAMGSVAMASDGVLVVRRSNGSVKRRMDSCGVKLLNLDFLGNLVSNGVVHSWGLQLFGLDLLVLDFSSNSGCSVLNRIHMSGLSSGMMSHRGIVRCSHVVSDGGVVSSSGMVLNGSSMVSRSYVRRSGVMDSRGVMMRGGMMGNWSIVVNLSMVDWGSLVMDNRSLVSSSGMVKDRGFMRFANVMSDRLSFLLSSVMNWLNNVRSGRVMRDSMLVSMMRSFLRLLKNLLFVLHQLLKKNLRYLDIFDSLVIFCVLFCLFRFLGLRCWTRRRSGNVLHSSGLMFRDVAHLMLLIRHSVGHIIVTRSVFLIPGAHIAGMVIVAGLRLEVVRLLLDNVLVVRCFHETRLSIAVVVSHESRIARGRSNEVSILGIVISLFG